MKDSKHEIEVFFFDKNLILEEFSKLEKLLYSKSNLIFLKYRDNDVLTFDDENQALLNNVSKKAIVYSIWVGDDKTDMEIQYIGHANARISRQRLRNHLCKKHKKTGAKLTKVEAALKSNKTIAVSIVEIQPEFMRKAFETWIIGENKEDLPWNRNT